MELTQEQIDWYNWQAYEGAIKLIPIATHYDSLGFALDLIVRIPPAELIETELIREDDIPCEIEYKSFHYPFNRQN